MYIRIYPCLSDLVLFHDVITHVYVYIDNYTYIRMFISIFIPRIYVCLHLYLSELVLFHVRLADVWSFFVFVGALFLPLSSPISLSIPLYRWQSPTQSISCSRGFALF